MDVGPRRGELLSDRLAGDSEAASEELARRGLLIAAILALAGSLLALIGVRLGTIPGAQAGLILSCVLFTAGLLATLLKFRNVPVQRLATATTVFAAIYLSAGFVISASRMNGAMDFPDAMVYLVWFFPLTCLNKLINAPAVGRRLARLILCTPIVAIACILPALLANSRVDRVLVLLAFSFSYVLHGCMLHVVTRYREKYIVERERAESLKIESAVLESISDCFISLDRDLKLVYLNDAACAEFRVDRRSVLRRTIESAVPDFSHSLEGAVRNAYHTPETTTFEVQNEARDRWFEMRCFPRPDGMSIYFRNITGRKTAEASIEELAFYDFLTELPNRRLLRKRLDDALARSLREGTFGALLFIDIDDFKTLNDTLGHNVGDVLLQQVALRLVACVRRCDTVARLGGDEFVVMLEDLSSDPDVAAEEARAFGDRVLAAFVQPFAVGGRVHNASVSVGIAMFAGSSAAGDTAEELLVRADLAMYRAKARGRNLVCFFDPTMETLVAARAALQADLHQALRERRFELHYQPQVDRNGNVIGAEALLRWPHPGRGHVAPAEFIALAEESGSIVELGRWALETACAQLAAWSAHRVLKNCTIAVNVSIRQFLDPNFVEIVLDVLRASGADPRKLKLELTESSMMENPDDTIVKMMLLQEHLVGFSLDDFGTGYSSLSYLKRLPLDQIKIDRSFVNDVLTDSRDASIARAIVALGRSLDLAIVAEGVETEGQRAFLEREGCDAFQGHFFSPALTAPAFEAFAISAASHVPLAAPV